MSNAVDTLPVPRDLLQDLYEAAQLEADQRRAALGYFWPDVQEKLDKIAADAKAILEQPAEQQVEYEIAGYEGSSGLYYSRLAAVANGEQSIEPVYRVKK